MKELRELELLMGVRDHFVKFPANLDQDVWAAQTECGTTYCVAGLTVLLAGDAILWQKFPGATVNCVDASGQTELIEIRAQELLGLTDFETDALFYCSNEEVLSELDKLIARRQKVSDENNK